GAIKPAFDSVGVKYGTAGTLTLGDNSDTTAAQSQLDSLIEKWKGENVNAFFVSGLATVSKDQVTKIKAAFPDALIMTDADSSAKGAAQDAQQKKVSPNPYDGIISLAGLTDQQQFDSPNVQKCVGIWEKASGTKVVPPNDLTPDKDGKRVE